MVKNTMSLSMLTDLYQLTMSYGYWKEGRLSDESVFHLYFRKHPFAGGYTVCAGLDSVLSFLEDFEFTTEDVDYLASLCGSDGRPLFESGFLDYLKALRLDLDVSAIVEGHVVFPQEPLLRVTGSLIQAQLIETTLLNLINFQTLIATKAARVVNAAGGDPVLEFGLRRAQGVDGGLAASRAAYIGGCAATSNVLAGQRFGIPVKGTHAHSWVMSYNSELQAFMAYAEAMPNNCLLLVDTYDSLAGVDHAIEVGQKLREQGQDLQGIRLDSGDLTWLSIQARKRLNAAGFEKTAIVASNDLDEHLIKSIKEQGAQIDVWGVGTKLATAFDQPALGGVYKLSAIRSGPDEPWRPTLKLSEQAAKVSTPGILGVRRFRREDGHNDCDMIYEIHETLPEDLTIVDPYDGTRRRRVKGIKPGEDLLVPVFEKGKRIYQSPPIESMQALAKEDLSHFYRGCLRLENPHQYPAGLERSLYERKMQLIMSARG